MTFALIMLVVFLVVWMTDTTKKRTSKFEHRKKTITNIPLQDQLSQENFLKIIADLEKMDKETFLTGDTLIDAIEYLYELYDIPDDRTEQQKMADRQKFKRDLDVAREYVVSPTKRTYPQDETGLTLSQRIWCVNYPKVIPHMEQPDLVFGTPNTTLTIDEFTYKYDTRGIAANVYRTIPAKLLGQIEVLLTMRDLRAKGFNYSWNRKDSLWQQSEAVAKQCQEREKKYPWLY